MNNTNDTFIRLSDRTSLIITSVDDSIVVQIISRTYGDEIGVLTAAAGSALVVQEPNGDQLMVLEPGFAQRVRFVGLDLVEG